MSPYNRDVEKRSTSTPAGRAGSPCAPTDRPACARRLCESRGAQWTPLRAEIYGLLVAHDAPLKAYELLEKMRAAHGRVAPMTVYRALDFLVDHGLVHRVASTSSFVACREPGAAHHDPVFLVCQRCGTAQEYSQPRLSKSIQSAARRVGFAAQGAEIPGLCAGCAPPAQAEG